MIETQEKLKTLQSSLLRRWKSRSVQVLELLGQFYVRVKCPPFVLVHGPSGTGKTSIVSDVLESLGYCISRVSSVECECSIQQFWSYIISGWSRNYNSIPRRKVSDIGDASEAVKKLKQSVLGPLCVVVDPIDSAVDLSHISALLELRRRSSVPFGIIFVSSTPWAALYPDARHLTAPQHVSFPAYSKDDILCILSDKRPDQMSQHLYETILSSFVKPAFHNSRFLTDAITLLDVLLEQVSHAPSNDPASVIAHLQSTCREFSKGLTEHYSGVRVSLKQVLSADKSCLRGSKQQPLSNVPRMTKLLILAAYIAGSNRPTCDRLVFGSSAIVGRKRKNDMAADRQVQAAEDEANAQGQAFTPERWLQIFYKLVEQNVPHGSKESILLLKDMQADQIRNEMRQLACIKLVNQITSAKDAIDGLSYTSKVSHDLSEAIAEALGVNLKAYVLYA